MLRLNDHFNTKKPVMPNAPLCRVFANRVTYYKIGFSVLLSNQRDKTVPTPTGAASHASTKDFVGLI